MDIRDLVVALIQEDFLRARQWVADAERAGFDWSLVAEPQGLSPVGLALAAEGPERLRRRGLLAPPDFLTAA